MDSTGTDRSGGGDRRIEAGTFCRPRWRAKAWTEILFFPGGAHDPPLWIVNGGVDVGVNLVGNHPHFGRVEKDDTRAIGFWVRDVKVIPFV